MKCSQRAIATGWAASVAALLLLLVLACSSLGCHLIFRYEDQAPDSGSADSSQADSHQGDKGAGDAGKDLAPTPDTSGRLDRSTIIDARVTTEGSPQKDKGAASATKPPGVAMPTPAGTKDLLAIWGSSPKRIFAVGQNATLLSFNGSSWSKISTPGSTGAEDFTGVWGEGSGSTSKLYISTSKGTLRAYKPGIPNWGIAFSTAGKALHTVHGYSTSVIVSAGEAGTLGAYANSKWSAPSLGFSDHLRGARAFSSGEYYLVGDGGRLVRYFHFQGLSWMWVPMTVGGKGCDLKAVWGLTEARVYAVGAAGCTLGLLGTSQKINFFTFGPASPAATTTWYGIWGNSSKEIFLVGYDSKKPSTAPIARYSGGNWTSHSYQKSGINPMSLRGVWGDGQGKVYAVGSSGIILRN